MVLFSTSRRNKNSYDTVEISYVCHENPFRLMMGTVTAQTQEMDYFVSQRGSVLFHLITLTRSNIQNFGVVFLHLEGFYFVIYKIP